MRDAARACRLALASDFSGHQAFNICSPITLSDTETGNSSAGIFLESDEFAMVCKVTGQDTILRKPRRCSVSARCTFSKNRNLPIGGMMPSQSEFVPKTYGATPFDQFLEWEEIPVIRNFVVSDIRKLPVEPWRRRGGLGCYIILGHPRSHPTRRRMCVKFPRVKV